MIRTIANRGVDWWNRMTGRTRRIIGVDFGGKECTWVKADFDTKTGKLTVVEEGKGVPTK